MRVGLWDHIESTWPLSTPFVLFTKIHISKSYTAHLLKGDLKSGPAVRATSQPVNTVFNDDTVSKHYGHD